MAITVNPGASVLTIDMIYPVGSIYMSMNDTSPASFIGGTWERINEGRFLLAAGSGDDNSTTYQAGATGGEEKHVLTTSEIPAHNHAPTVSKRNFVTVDNSGNIEIVRKNVASGTAVSNAITSSQAFGAASNTTANAGGGQAHNNMPPYLAVHMWKRTA